MPRSKKPTFSLTVTTRFGRARLGTLTTPHGIVRTPAYVIVATHAAVRALKPADLKRTKTQLVISNTYHLWGKSDAHKMIGARIPMMTDSGGFQVFSLGAAKEHGVGKVLKRGHTKKIKDQSYSSVVIDERGAHFAVNGKHRTITPESSMKTQERLGADIIFAFDECTSPLHPLAHNRQAMERTHRWALRCLKAHTKADQWLFGIVQGGRFKSLRTASAKKLATMPFDGFGIGGSFGKDEMRKTLAWVVPHLPDAKPRHLLGIGTVTDIFDAVEAGVDTFDCVIPTREARHGRIYTATGTIDIRKSIYTKSSQAIDAKCECPTCDLGTSRAALRALFKAHDEQAARLATIHNVWFFNDLLERIRATLADGSYLKFKQRFLTRFSK